MDLGGLGLSGLVVSFVTSTTLMLDTHRPSSAGETSGNSERPSHDKESNPVSLDSGNPLPSTEGGVGVTRSKSPRSIMAGGRQIVYVDDAITVSGIPASRTKSASVQAMGETPLDVRGKVVTHPQRLRCMRNRRNKSHYGSTRRESLLD